MIKILIIEDEYSGQQLNSIITDNYTNCKVVAIADSVVTGIEEIKKNTPHIVLIDVQLKDGSGFDILSHFEGKRNFEIIFVTAYVKYAINAIKEEALDYFLKPINILEFKAGLEKAILKVTKKTNKNPLKQISIYTSNGIDIIPYQDIIFMKADGAYTFIHTKKDKILSSKNIGDYESYLSTDMFFRIHHSYIVNLSHIVNIKKARGGTILLSNGETIPVSQRKLTDFLNIFKRAKENDVTL